MGTIEGDIFNESNKGTFLTSLDNIASPPIDFSSGKRILLESIYQA